MGFMCIMRHSPVWLVKNLTNGPHGDLCIFITSESCILWLIVYSKFRWLSEVGWCKPIVFLYSNFINRVPVIVYEHVHAYLSIWISVGKWFWKWVTKPRSLWVIQYIVSILSQCITHVYHVQSMGRCFMSITRFYNTTAWLQSLLYF